MNAEPTVTAGLFAALRLARGRADGVILLPDDRKTLWRSFWAIPICVPLVVARLVQPWLDTGVPADAVHQIAREIVVFVVGWLAFVEITHHMALAPGKPGRWGRFIALWNWCNVVEGVLVVAGCIPGMLHADPIVDQTAQIVTLGWAFWLEWYAARLTLGIGAAGAMGIVALDQLIGIVLATVAMSLGS